MIPEGNILNNVLRFSGFEREYNKHRPKAPELVVEILTMYLGRNPSVVVDLGCGTGLSTFIWKDCASRIIGVEPNDDMRGKALESLSELNFAGDISIVKGYSNQLQMESTAADIVTCSQSFHWMEPVSTLQEAARVLREGGIFAAYDCDWPPTVNWRVEDQYNRLIDKADRVIRKHSTEEAWVKKWPKDGHLKNIQDSGAFRFAKEIVFHNREICDADRYIGLAISQGGLQTVLKSGWTDLNDDLAAFEQTVEAFFGGRTLNLVFSYRMRLGIK